jgi:hypothetical protein
MLDNSAVNRPCYDHRDANLEIGVASVPIICSLCVLACNLKVDLVKGTLTRK